MNYKMPMCDHVAVQLALISDLPWHNN